MQKLTLVFLLLFPCFLFAQERSKIILEKSANAHYVAKDKATYLRNPIFRHDNAVLTCDSAILYEERNFFDAFGNVHINQADTVNIFSERLSYDGNTKKAHLTNNVRMVDKTTVLTTNILDYNMGLKIGTYITGGKIVSKVNTITSKNGYYFANTSDSYFRYNVLVVTPQTTIKSDTLRYNTLTNVVYFYGPTNIKGKDDNLYTENGTYNTKNENAYFGKKNLYTQGSKSLKGDSLIYDGKRGYGKAIKNIVFVDTLDKTLLRGQLGEYYKADEKVVVTKNAYLGMATTDTLKVNNKIQPDTLWISADTLKTQRVLQKTLTLLPKPIIKKDNEVGSEKEKPKEKLGSGQILADNSNSNKKENKKLKKENKKPITDARELVAEENKALQLKLKDSTTTLKKDTTIAKLKTDSIAKNTIVAKPTDTVKPATKINPQTQKTATDNVKPTLLKPIKSTNPKLVTAKDTAPFNPADTVRTRVITAYRNVRVFKGNLQAKADSLFYTAADSVMRWYKNPIIWAEGSQQTGDTIYVHLKDKKLSSIQILQNAFLVNIEGDSTKFNQVKGKLITGFFIAGDLKKMYVDGNAESIYFSKDDKGKFDKMSQTVSSRIKFIFENKELTDILAIKDVEAAVTPVDKLPKENILTGFIWKPELRPTSKADVIRGLQKAIVSKKPKPNKIIPAKKPKPITSQTLVLPKS